MIAPPPFFARTGRESARHAQRPDKVHFKLLARGLDRPVGEKTARPCDAGIVDEQVDVPGRARRGDDVFVAGDFQFQRHDALQGNRLRIARRGVDLRRPHLHKRLGKGEAEAPVGARHQGD